MLPSEDIVGYKITTACKDECINQIFSWNQSGKKGKYFVTVNPHSLYVSRTDALFDEAIKNADLVVPDGIGIVIASKILGGNIHDRITGSDIFFEISKALNNKGGISYFFLGSTEENLAEIKEKMQREFPNINVVGTYSPPFKTEFSDEDNRLMIKAINRVKPDVLWVGMTAPKQEKWAYRHKDQLGVKLIGPVGALFYFYTGKVKRSHPWFQRHGFEWLPRLLREPRRLWRRNFISYPMFLLHVMAQRFFR